MKKNRTPPELSLLQLAHGYWISQCIYVVTELGIPDLLEEGKYKDVETIYKKLRPKPETETETKTKIDYLYRVLRTLAKANQGIFVENKNRCFKLTSSGRYLQKENDALIKDSVLNTKDFYEDSYQVSKNLIEQFFESINEKDLNNLIEQLLRNINEQDLKIPTGQFLNNPINQRINKLIEQDLKNITAQFFKDRTDKFSEDLTKKLSKKLLVGSDRADKSAFEKLNERKFFEYFERNSHIDQFLQIAHGYWISQCIYVVTKLGIPDLFKKGEEKDVKKIRKELKMNTETETDSDPLYRVLRTLANQGVFVENENRCFKLGSSGEYLQEKNSKSIRNCVLMTEHSYEVAPKLLGIFEEGNNNVFKETHGESFFEYLKHKSVFNNSMLELTKITADPILESYKKFSEKSSEKSFSIRTVADIGGGTGGLLGQILEKNSSVHGILFDLPHVVDEAKTVLKSKLKQTVYDRCEFVRGNFCEPFPDKVKADIYILKHIVHDWDDDTVIELFKKCCKVMSDNSRLLIIEAIIDREEEPFFPYLQDIKMLALLGARERTKDEYKQLLSDANLKVEEIFPTDSYISIIEVAKKKKRDKEKTIVIVLAAIALSLFAIVMSLLRAIS